MKVVAVKNYLDKIRAADDGMRNKLQALVFGAAVCEPMISVLNNGQRLRIYDQLREMHKLLKRVWQDYPELIDSGLLDEHALDAVDMSLYVAESVFADQECLRLMGLKPATGDKHAHRKQAKGRVASITRPNQVPTRR